MLLYCLLPALFAQEADDEFDFLKGPDVPKEKVGGDFVNGQIDFKTGTIKLVEISGEVGW